jgi:hypothetical protein
VSSYSRSWARLKTRSVKPAYNERGEGAISFCQVVSSARSWVTAMCCCHLSAGRCCSVLLRVEQLVQQMFTLYNCTVSCML